MKRFAKFAVLAIAVLAISACGGKKETPEAVAEKFVNHLNKKEYAEAKKLGTEKTGQMVDMLESFGSMKPDAEPKKEGKIENLKCETKDDKSTCTYTNDGKDEKVELIKKDGKWLVDMDKETGSPDQTPVPTDSTATEPAK